MGGTIDEERYAALVPESWHIPVKSREGILNLGRANVQALYAFWRREIRVSRSTHTIAQSMASVFSHSRAAPSIQESDWFNRNRIEANIRLLRSLRRDILQLPDADRKPIFCAMRRDDHFPPMTPVTCLLKKGLFLSDEQVLGFGTVINSFLIPDPVQRQDDCRATAVVFERLERPLAPYAETMWGNDPTKRRWYYLTEPSLLRQDEFDYLVKDSTYAGLWLNQASGWVLNPARNGGMYTCGREWLISMQQALLEYATSRR